MSMSAAVIMVCVLSAVAVGQVTAPRKINKIKDGRPVYPRESLQAGDEGVVLLELNVTPSGTVGQARVIWSECKRVEQAALTAARQWQYAQMLVNGKPAPFTIVTDVPFRLPARFKERAGRTGACKWKDPPKPTH
jgi:TonB family protein